MNTVVATRPPYEIADAAPLDGRAARTWKDAARVVPFPVHRSSVADGQAQLDESPATDVGLSRTSRTRRGRVSPEPSCQLT